MSSYSHLSHTLIFNYEQFAGIDEVSWWYGLRRLSVNVESPTMVVTYFCCVSLIFYSKKFHMSMYVAFYSSSGNFFFRRGRLRTPFQAFQIHKCPYMRALAKHSSKMRGMHLVFSKTTCGENLRSFLIGISRLPEKQGLKSAQHKTLDYALEMHQDASRWSDSK